MKLTQLLTVGATVGLLFASALVTGPALAATPTPSATASTSGTSAPATPDQKVWLVGSPDESFTDQVNRSLAVDPSSAANWVHTLTGLQSLVKAGRDISLPGNATTTATKLSQLSNALTSASTAKTNARSQAVSPNAAAGTSYELRGYTINSSTGWQVQTEIDGAFCDPSGCDTTDVTRQTWKITPGRSGDRFSFTSIRTGSGNLTQIYANLSVVCGNTVCGTGSAGKSGPQDGSGSGSPTVTHTSNAGGTQVDRVQMHAHFNPNGGTYYDSVKTGTAKCGTGDNYACKF